MNDVTTTRELKIKFIKSDGSAWNLTVPDFTASITDEAVEEGANAILAENVFAPGGLSLIKAENAVKVVTTKTTVDWN